MELSVIFKSVIDSDNAPVVICDLKHIIIYMNPAAAKRYEKRGGYDLVGRSLLNCHSEESVDKIKKVLDWFIASTDNNKVYEFYSEKENKDVYMVALRDDNGKLLGYYEKHEFRDRETSAPYEKIF